MLKKGTKLYSVFNNKCPKCNEGNFFLNRNFLDFRNLTKLNERCSHCNLKYMMEPSFFYGAMFVNYALTVAASIAIFVVCFLIFHLSLLQSFISIVIGLILLTPFTLRLARLIWINIFVKFDRDSSTSR